jgi:hypothetical protein
LLKKRVGVLGDDGDSIVDKYTGFKLSTISLDYSEDYDEDGFAIKTHDIITVDDENIKQQVMNNIQNEKEMLMILTDSFMQS